MADTVPTLSTTTARAAAVALGWASPVGTGPDRGDRVTPHIDRGNSMQLAPGGRRLIWLAEVGPACALLDTGGSVALELAAELRAAAEHRDRSCRRIAPTAFRYVPAPEHAELLGRTLEVIRDRKREAAA